MKQNAEGANPMIGNKYLNISRNEKPSRILFGASFPWKNEVFASSVFFLKAE